MITLARLFMPGVIIWLLSVVGITHLYAGEIKLTAPAVAYQPSGFIPVSQNSDLTESQIRTDLRLLYRIGFRGIVTYGSMDLLGKIPEIARSEGFDGIIIMGIWDIFSEHEWQNALSQVYFVDGFCLGNEGLGIRYDANELSSQMNLLRKATDLPVTTSEPIFKYFKPAYRQVLCEATDWIFPNIHPFWDQPFEVEKATEWIIVHCDYLSVESGRNIIIKEAGYPTDGHTILSQQAQIQFFMQLSQTGLNFFHFEAFDQPWKKNVLANSPIEAHWGLFKVDRTPKKIVAFLTEQWAE